MAKEKQTFLEKVECSLNKLHKKGINFDLYYYNGKYNLSNENISPAETVKYLDYEKSLLGKMHFEGDVIAIMCDDLISFKLLELNTIALEDKFQHKIVYFFKYEQVIYEQLKEELDCYCIEVNKNTSIPFTLKHLPKVYESKDRKFTYATLPRISQYTIKQILNVANMLEQHKGYHFQINQGNKYRISVSTILNLLSSPVLTVNERKVFESVLRTITNSTYVLDTSQTDKEFRIPIKTFSKGLKLSRNTQTVEELISSAFDTFIYYGLADTFSIDDNIITFTACQLASELTNQNVQREYGFYNNIPGTKKSSKLAAWLDYIWVILKFTRHGKKLQIALDTLLERLDLIHLLDNHRIKDIAEWLNTLSNIGIAYKLLVDKKISFNNETVQTLLKERSSLHKYLILNDVAKSNKDGKRNETQH